jgi:hypothetical protein
MIFHDIKIFFYQYFILKPIEIIYYYINLKFVHSF